MLNCSSASWLGAPVSLNLGKQLVKEGRQKLVKGGRADSEDPGHTCPGLLCWVVGPNCVAAPIPVECQVRFERPLLEGKRTAPPPKRVKGESCSGEPDGRQTNPKHPTRLGLHKRNNSQSPPRPGGEKRGGRTRFHAPRCPSQPESCSHWARQVSSGKKGNQKPPICLLPRLGMFKTQSEPSPAPHQVPQGRKTRGVKPPTPNRKKGPEPGKGEKGEQDQGPKTGWPTAPDVLPPPPGAVGELKGKQLLVTGPQALYGVKSAAPAEAECDQT